MSMLKSLKTTSVGKAEGTWKRPKRMRTYHKRSVQPEAPLAGRTVSVRVKQPSGEAWSDGHHPAVMPSSPFK